MNEGPNPQMLPVNRALHNTTTPPPWKYQNGRTLQEEGGDTPLPPLDHPPFKTEVTIMETDEIYHWENLVGPFLVHKFLPPPPPFQCMVSLSDTDW